MFRAFFLSLCFQDCAVKQWLCDIFGIVPQVVSFCVSLNCNILRPQNFLLYMYVCVIDKQRHIYNRKLYSSPNIVWVIKSRRMRWAWACGAYG